MSFYILRVLLPALLADVLITRGFLRKRKLRQIDKWAAAFVASALYFISAIAWCFFYGGDPRFQGQGVLGLLMFFVVGIALSAVRLALGFHMLGLLPSSHKR